MTNLRINKLVYFAHDFYLALSEKPLLACLDGAEFENLEAWTYGPVVPSLYHTFKHAKGKLRKEHKYKIIKVEESEAKGSISENACEVNLNMEDSYVKKVVDILSKVFFAKTTWELVQDSHVKNSP